MLEEEAEPDWVQFQSFVFVHGVLLRVDVECFLDSPLQTVTLAIDHLSFVEIKGKLFEDRMLSSSRHVKSSAFDVGRVLLDAYTGSASCFSVVCLFTVTTLETIQHLGHSLDWSDLSSSAGATASSFLALISNYSYIQRPQDSLQGLGYSIDKWHEHCCLSLLILGLSISISLRLLRLPLFNPGQAVVDEACRVVIGKQLLVEL